MAATSLAAQVGVALACRALGLARATFYRRQRPAPGSRQPRTTPARALDNTERERVLDVLASPRFLDRSPGEVVATLLDEGRYLCSERTMYRSLAAEQPVRERRNQLRHPHYAKPELLATAPNQVWSWDITRLLGPKRWTYFYLYVLLADLGVTRSLGRSQVSDDNPFSEAQFKTLKYHPGFPGRFKDIHAQQILEQRQRTLQDAWAHNPERFVHGPPNPQALPKAVWINPPTEAKTSPDAH